MGKLRCSGRHLGKYDREHDVFMGILDKQSARVVADIYHSNEQGYFISISHVVWKSGVFRIDILHKISKDLLYKLEIECIRSFINGLDDYERERDLSRFSLDSDTEY